MSDRDDSEWQLGMTLPSRKETHGRKKKSGSKREQDRKESVPAKQQEGDLPDASVTLTPTATLEASTQPEAMQETAATAELAVRDALEEDGSFLRNLLEKETMPATPVAMKQETDKDVDSETEEAPVISKWKLALFVLLAPIVLVVVLAWGKLAYVHQVPGFVRQQVHAYQTGDGFLILKPWWFGPTVFALDQYPRQEGDDYEHWKLQLTDYESIVQDPDVLYTFQQDILHTK